MTSNTRLVRNYLSFTVGLALFTWIVYRLEQAFGAGVWIGYVFLFMTIALYAVIGMLSRTSNLLEYYVAGRRVPSVFNGMATAADWLSAASFIGLAGSLFASGYDGLAYIVGWTGGFCLVAVLLAPYVRKLARYTIPDFLATRYDSNGVRAIAVFATILCSFVYLVAQIQGVGLIASRFIGVEFTIGIVFGLAGILVCSFLGGMRAVTWTQVAQYIILISAVLVAASMIGHRNGLGWLPQLSYGRAVERVEAVEAELRESVGRGEGEALARARYRDAARAMQAKIDALPEALAVERRALQAQVDAAHRTNATLRETRALERQLARLPADAADARVRWSAERDVLARHGADPVPIAEPYPAASPAEARRKTVNFIALVLSLTVGTASLPHVLTRYATATSVASARHAVGWTLFFISLFYLTVPVLAVLVKYELMQTLLGQRLDVLPAWVVQWSQMEPSLVRVSDITHSGTIHWAGIDIQPDMIVLAAPEIAGLPYVISGLVAAGALAAALSTADGLLLTIANALSHDVYYKMVDAHASSQRRVTMSKVLLLGVALGAAYLASLSAGNILFLVGAAFSLAASSLFPSLVLGVFWQRMTTRGAVASMLAGLAVCVYYLVTAYAPFAHLLGRSTTLWFDVDPGSAGVFGVPVGFVVAVVVSLFDRDSGPEARRLVERMRRP